MAESACRLARTGTPLPKTATAWLLAALLAGALPAHGESGQAAIEAGRLKQIRAQIETLRDELGAVRGRHEQELRALEQTDKRIGQLGTQLRATERELQRAGRQLDALKAQRTVQRSQLRQQRTTLGRELRASYKGTGEQRIRMLLSQDDPSEVGRMLVYQGYLARARARGVRTRRTGTVGSIGSRSERSC